MKKTTTKRLTLSPISIRNLSEVRGGADEADRSSRRPTQSEKDTFCVTNDCSDWNTCRCAP